MAKDPLFMAGVLFQPYMECKSGWFHREWMEMLNSDYSNVCIVAPRGSAKTTNIDFIWTVWNVLFTDHHYILAISNTYDKAKKMILQPIKDAFDNNELIKELFGDIRGDRWSATELEFAIPTANGVSKKKIDIAGVGQSIRGMRYLQYRPDIVIADDIEDDEQIRSAARRKEIVEWFWKQVYHAMRKENANIEDGSSFACKPKKIVVGTILHRDSFLQNILDMVKEDEQKNKRPDWCAKKYSILYTDEKGKQRALWEERDTVEEILAEREEAKRNGMESAWVQEKMNEVMSDDDKPINIDLIQFYEEEQVEKRELFNYVAIDLALSSGSKPSNERDYNAVVAISVDRATGDIYVRGYDRFQTNDVNLTVNKALNMAEEYYVEKVIFEKGGFQGSIEMLLNQEMRKRGEYYRIEGKTHGNMKKQDRIRMTVAYYANRKKLWIKKEHRELYDEMYDFPVGRHDDLLDGLTYAIVGADPKFISFKDYVKTKQSREPSLIKRLDDAEDAEYLLQKRRKTEYNYI